MSLIVDNLPSLIYPECAKVDDLHYSLVRGIDPFWSETDEVKIMIDENKKVEDGIFDEREEQPAPNNSVNLQELYVLTRMIQDDIWGVTKFRPTGKIRTDTINRQINQTFLDYGIDNYASQLEVFIKSLIIDDGWNPQRFRGYQYLLTMIRETKGLAKMNHLQALTNKARIMIPPDISTTPVHVIEPSISKSSNPSDA